MGLWQRMIRSLTRQKGKSLLLFFILFVIGNAMAGTIAIREGTINVQSRIKQMMGPVVLIKPATSVVGISGSGRQSEGIDFSKLKFVDIPVIIDGKTHMLSQLEDPSLVRSDMPSAELLEQIGNSPYVSYYDYSEAVVVGSGTLRPIEGAVGVPHDLDHFGFTLYGTQQPALGAVEYGGARLVAGRMFNQEEIEQGLPVAMMSSAFAELNSISPEDMVLFTNYPAFDFQEELIIGQIDIPVKIVGLIEYPIRPTVSFKGRRGSGTPEDARLQMLQNVIYTPNRLLQDINQRRFQQLVDFGIPEGLDETRFHSEVLDPMFVLSDPDDIPAFIEENEALLPADYRFFSNFNAYADISQPVRQTRLMADSVLLFSIAAAVVIVGLTVLLFIRDRRYEVGIMMSLGETKTKIIGQIVGEVLLVALLALTLSLLTGQMIANRLSDAMIRDEIAHQLDYSQDEDFWLTRENMGQYANFVSGEDVAKSYQITFSGGYVGRFLGLGLASASLATLLPIMYVINLRPRKVLMP